MNQSRFVTRLACVLACASAAVFGAAQAPASDAAPVTTLTAEQRAALRAELAKFLNQSNEGLVSRVRADGAVSIELDGRHAHAMIARPSAAGRPDLACFDDPDAAVAFLARDDRRATPAPSTARKPAPEERDR